MTKILVNATANDSRGPLSLTKCFLKDLVEYESQLMKDNIFITVLVSNKDLLEYNAEHIEVIYDPKPKLSFFHKYKYEHYDLPALMKEKNYDSYLSLQNTAIKKGPWKQIVLIQVPLPFSKIGWNDMDKKNFIKYKILFKNILAKQLKNMDEIIVQTEWMKESISKMGFIKNITIHRPAVENFSDFCYPLPPSVESKIEKATEANKVKMLYPTNLDRYKNNERLISAVKLYNQRSAQRKVVLFLTLEGEDEEDIKYLGRVPFESMYTLYKNMDSLLFASLIETLGLPLIEAEQSGIGRIVADREYAKEICKENAYYFDPLSVESIIESIGQFVWKSQTENEREKTFIPSFNEKDSSTSYYDYIKIIQNVR